MPLNFPFDLENDAFLASLFLAFATILHKESTDDARTTERKRLAFIYNFFRMVHPTSKLYTEQQLDEMINGKTRDSVKRAGTLAKKVQRNLLRASHAGHR